MTTPIATLKAANCSRLLYIAERTVAACGTKTAYVFHFKDDKTEEASCTAPREADVFAPWLPPGVPITATRVVYSVRKDGGAAVFVRPADNAAAAPLEIIAAVPEKVEEMRVFYQSILALRTSSCVHFYFLDPSTAAATSMGSCALPAWSDNRDVRVDVTSSECWAAATEMMLCVVCLSAERLFVAVIVCASSSSAVVVRHTVEAGVPLPCSSSSSPLSSAAASPAKVLGWTVRWRRQELLLLLQSQGGAEKVKELASFSLQVSGSSATHPQLQTWTTAAADTTSFGGATSVALTAATDVCSDGDGSHVWLCDTVTAPSVTMREITTPNSEAAVLTGTNANARLTVAQGVPGVFVLAGRSLFVVQGSDTGVTEGAVSEAETQQATMSDWLEKQQQTKQSKMSPLSRRLEQDAPAASAAAPQLEEQPASKPLQKAATSDFTSSSSSSSHIREKLMQYVLGTAASVPFVVRDAVYVRVADDARDPPRHAILDAITEKLADDVPQRALATLRYASVAQSLHPYTVLELLRVRQFSMVAEEKEGFLLALATVLAGKATLQHGGLQRLPNFAAVSAAFFCTTSGPFTTELAKKQYTADLCACAMAALANGGLGATRLLFAVADRAVSVLYGGRADSSAAAWTAEEQTCEATIAEAISLTRSFVEWSLTASSSLGVISAHVGSPQFLTKEASLRDGKAHPIDTSRQVEIRPLQVTRLPKRTL